LEEGNEVLKNAGLTPELTKLFGTLKIKCPNS
jgi:hypothetical protein